ncbi:YrbL family protein [Vibrio rumoiensis]
MQKPPKCIGLIDTNLGDGLVYELIKDYDGNRSKSLAYYYKKMK